MASTIFPVTQKYFQKDTAGTLTTGLVSYYKLAGNANDFFGSNQGTVNGSPVLGSGIIGQGYDFQNVQTNYIDVPYSASLAFGTTFSLSCWVKLDGSVNGTAVMGKWNGQGGSSSNDWALLINYTDVIFYSNGNSGLQATVASGVLTVGSWMHIVGTYDGAHLTLYINNVQKGTPQAQTGNSNHGTSDVWVGNYSGTGSNQALDGTLAEVGIWNKTVSSTEISDLYNSGAGDTMVGNVEDSQTESESVSITITSGAATLNVSASDSQTVTETSTVGSPTVPPASLKLYSQTYNDSYTGSVVPWVCPVGVTSVIVTLNGAQGANGSSSTSAFGPGAGGLGGNGAKVVGTYSVTPGTTYYYYVGGQGDTSSSGGGGVGGTALSTAGSGGAGGGMTWFSSQNTFDHAHAIAVAAGGAGGGGGGVGVSPDNGQNGGAGGTDDANGSNGSQSIWSGNFGQFGSAGTTSGGGALGSGGGGAQPGNNGGNGGVGTGGAGGNAASGGAGGGAGGGYNGGGGGGGGGNNISPTVGAGGGGGGGGASYLSLLANSSLGTGFNAGNGSLTLMYNVVDDSVPTSETVSMSMKDFLSASDSVGTSDSVSMRIVNLAYDDVLAQVGVSNYKWLTPTLYSAQNQFTVRPAISCRIADQSTVFGSQLFNNAPGGGSVSGSSCMAPDGTILTVSHDTAGDLVFAKVTDGTQVSQWDKAFLTGGTVIATSGNWSFLNQNLTTNTFHLNADISCSDWIGTASGGYVIDVFYFFNDGNTWFSLKRARSTDGGSTWSTVTFPGTGSGRQIPYGTQGFFGVAAGKPVWVPATGNVSSTCFCVTGSTSAEANQVAFMYSPLGDYTDVGLGWNELNVSQLGSSASGDFVMQGVGVEYVNGTYYVLFSAYRQYLENTNNVNALSGSVPIATPNAASSFFGNFALYLTKVMQPSEPTPVWDEPREILTFNSSSSTNFNQCLYPSLRYDGTYLWATFRGDLTLSVSETGNVTMQTNYYISKSKDLENFDYPVPVVDGSGNSLTNPVPGSSYSNGLCRYVFVGKQNGYYYFMGDGALWQFVQNNTVADVSNDILSVQVQDQTGGASSINLTVSNASGKWAGPNPTGPNYQAIWKNGMANVNSKIYLQLGYYSAVGAETVPRNVYYVTDITQNITSNGNDLVIVGQDFNFLLSSTQTRFSYTFQGPDFYNDPFINSTVSNWNQSAGTWNVQSVPITSGSSSGQSFNAFTPWSTYQLPNPPATTNGTFVLTSPTLAVLSGYPIHRPTASLSCSFYVPSGATAGSAEYDFYPFYVNPSNFIQVQVIYNGASTVITVNQTYNGNVASSFSGSAFTLATGNWYSAYVTMSSYAQQIDVGIGTNYNYGNGFTNFANIIGNLSHSVSANAYASTGGTLPSVAIGTNGTFGTDTSTSTAPLYGAFANLRFAQYTYSQSIGDLITHLGTKAHVFDYAQEQDFVQDMTTPTQWNATVGTFSVKNRRMNLSGQSAVMQNSLQYGNGQVEFDASVVTSASQNYGFDFVFRSQSSTSLVSCYKLRFMQSQNGSGTVVKASLLISGFSTYQYNDQVLFSSIIPDSLPLSVYTGNVNLNVDLTQTNHYRVAFNKGWMYAYVNGMLAVAWYDDNYDVTYSTGYWGFSTVNPGYPTSGTDYAFDSLETLLVCNVRFPTFWNQNPVLAVNTGDDFQSALMQTVQTVFGWFFSDLRGFLKAVTLKATDVLSYWYGNGAKNYLLSSASVDSSSKEYYNAVLVVGDGVTYLATNGSSVGSNGVARDKVLVDYTITTVAGAQVRGNQELSNIQKYGTQPAPHQIINVGSEVFDVVNVQDTGLNSTNLNGNYRLYTETFNVDNQSNYSITLGTGAVSSNT